MANVDVSQLMTDPDFVDQIQVIGRWTTVNEYGENELTDVVMPTVGSVQPASGRTLQRLPEALRVANVSSFWVKTPPILAQGPGRYPSILVFRGKRYQVQNIFDWSNFGEGYTEGTCVAEKPA